MNERPITPQDTNDLILAFRGAQENYVRFNSIQRSPRVEQLLHDLPGRLQELFASLLLLEDFRRMDAPMSDFNDAMQITIRLLVPINDRLEASQPIEARQAIHRLFGLCDEMSRLYAAIDPVSPRSYPDDFLPGPTFSEN